MKVDALLIALAALLAPIQAQAQAQQQPASQAAPAQAQAITLAFAPPLGTDLRYRVTTHRISDGKPVDIEVIQTLRFTRAGDGYVMRIASLRFATGGMSIAVDDPHTPLLMRLVGAPVEVDLDAAGNPLRIRDWPAVQKRSADVMAGMLAIAPAGSVDRATMERVGKAVLAHFASMTAEQATAQWLQSWSPILGVGGLTMDDGQTVDTDSEMDLGFGAPVPTRMTATMRSKGAQAVTLTTDTKIDSARLGASVGALLKRITADATADPAARARNEETANMLKGATLDDRVEIVLDRATGLPTSADIRRTFTVSGQPPATSTIRIEHVD